MFRFFEKLVDPYQAYASDDTPPRALLPFLRNYLYPFKKIFWVLGVFSFTTAFIEIGLIWYLGRLIMLLTDVKPTEFWAENKAELISVSIFILTVRPM